MKVPVKKILAETYSEQALMDLAAEGRCFSYAPYSRFSVGAALLCSDGSVYTGCNIENASFGATNCAERTALFKAVADGHRNFVAIAITGGPSEEPDAAGTDGPASAAPCFPCGICRQTLSEFCGPDFRILLNGEDGTITTKTLGELLPFAFHLED